MTMVSRSDTWDVAQGLLGLTGRCCYPVLAVQGVTYRKDTKLALFVDVREHVGAALLKRTTLTPSLLLGHGVLLHR